MNGTMTDGTRRAAIAGAVGAALTAASGVIVQFAVQPSSNVSDKLWSYPWSSTALIPVSLVYASLHVLVFIGLVALRSSRAIGSSRASRRGLSLALAGTALLFGGELGSIAIRHAGTDDTSAMAVGMFFAGGIVLTAIGFLVTGRATMRAGTWEGWRRYTPLLAGIWSSALMAVNATKALPTGVALYGVCLLAVFYAQLTAPTAASTVGAHAPQAV